MISINSLYKNFGNVQALADVTLELHPSKVYALVGPNGSGKTTMIKSILGMVVPSKGDITLNGESILNSWKYRDKIGYMPQIGKYPDNLKIGQLLDMMNDIRPEKTARDFEIFKAFKMDQLADKRMHTLSGGTRQKVSAVLAFLFDPPVLILDEPTAGLDPLSVEILKDKIRKEKEKNKLIIISSHIMSDLDDLATDIVYMHEGKLVFSDSLSVLKELAGEEKLGKAISHLINQTQS